MNSKILKQSVTGVMKYILKALAFCTEFITVQNPVAVCACDFPEYVCFVQTKSPVLFKYTSDFIWMLGKNNLDSLVSAACFQYGRHELLQLCIAADGSRSNLLVNYSVKVY
jgi:hypothetical protein